MHPARRRRVGHRAGVGVELRLVLEGHVLAVHLEVEVEVDPLDATTGRRSKGGRGMQHEVVDGTAAQLGAQHPPSTGHGEPELVALDDLDLAPSTLVLALRPRGQPPDRCVGRGPDQLAGRHGGKRPVPLALLDVHARRAHALAA